MTVAPEALAEPATSAAKRGARGVIQGGVAGAILEAVSAFNIYEFTTRQFAVSLIILAAIISFVQNKIENDRGSGFLR